MRSLDHAGLAAVLLLGMAVPIGKASAQRIAPEIQAPVATSFGTYVPYTVPKYTPEVGLSEPTVSPNFSNVATSGTSFPWSTLFSAGERTLLVRNGMVARPEPIGTFGQAYSPSMSAADLPAFITVDAVAHGLRVSSEEAFRTAEREHVRPAVASMLDDLSQIFSKQLSGEKNRTLYDAERRLLAYLETGRALLDSRTSIDDRVGDMVDAELSQIRAASGTAQSNIVPATTIDYSRFRPTGYYAGDAASSDFYRARIWLSDVGFPLRSGSGSDAELSRMAILLARSMDNLAGSGDFRDRYLGVNEIYAFFAGGIENDLSWDAIAGATRGYYGRMVTSDASAIADDDQLGKFVDYLQDQLPSGRGSGTRSFHLLQPTASPGGSLFSKVTSPGGSQGLGLAVAAALGSDRARGLAGASAANAGIARAMTRPTEDWVEDINWSLLYTALPMVAPVDRSGGYPRFMRSDAWHDREITGGLGAWADYIHPLATMQMSAAGSAAKVSYAGGGNLETDGYAEPNPEAWGRLASLAAYIRSGLTDSPYGRMIDEKLEAKLHDIENVSAVMMQVAARELEGKGLTDAQLTLMTTMPGRIAAYETFLDKSLKGTGGDPVVAGATSAGSTTIATGHPLSIYVIVPRNDGEGGLMLAHGAIYSYFEPAVDPRGWQDAISRAGASSVPTPVWMADFTSTDRGGFAQDARSFRAVTGTIPAATVAYVPSEADRKRALPTVDLDMESNVVRRSAGELWVTVRSQQLDGVDVVLSVVNTAGRVVYTSSPGRIEGGERLDVVRVEDFPSGQYFLRVSDQTDRQLASGRFVVVR